MTPYTRLENSSLWRAAEAAYADPRRHYHGFSHVLTLYAHAAHTFGLAYDPALDRAILAHDAVLDGLGQHEVRSADWLETQCAEAGKVEREHILRTIAHHPEAGPDADNRMVLLDLADFMFEDRALANLDLVRREAAAMASRAPAAEGLVDRTADGSIDSYLGGLAARIENGRDASLPDQEACAFRRILAGIALVRGRLEIPPVTRAAD